MHVALFQPQIAPNTGNIIRLCANTGVTLHLIHPLGFVWDDKRLRRAGLDYAEFAEIHHHDDWTAFTTALQSRRIWALTTRGQSTPFEAHFAADDVLLFGSETSGLSPEIHAALPAAQKLRLPMQKSSRSMNLANAVAVTVYEAWRQTRWDGLG